MAKLISADLTDNKLCILEYTTTDGQMLSINPDSFDAKIVSLTYTDIGNIVFQRPITTIGYYAFLNYSNLSSVTIPDSVTTIGERAFYNCSSLTSVTIPDSVTKIGDRAFGGCSSLTRITIPDSVTTIGERAFGGCSSLTEFSGKYASEDGRCLIIDGTLHSIAPAGLTEYTIPDSVTYIGEHAFSVCCSLTEFSGKYASEDGRCLIIDGTLHSIAPAGLTEYTIPDSVTTIGNSAFYGCSSLTSVTIPDSVTYIGEHAFSVCCSLTSVIIPDSVTIIGKWAFSGCSSLTSVTIPDSVTTIGNSAFYGCSSLKNVTIGSNVRKIGKWAFERCNIDTIVCCPQVPPELYDSFDRFENLIIPTGCEKAYANSDWGQYLAKPYPSFFYAIKSPYKLVYFLFLIPLLLIFLSILCKFAIYSFAVGE